MDALTLLWLAALLPICLVGPGLALTRGMRLGVHERVVVSIASSALVVFFIAFALFVARAPASSTFVVLPLAIAGLVRERTFLVRAARHRPTRRIVGWGLVVVGWTVLVAAVMRVPGGGNWAFDWVEHFLRARFFLQRWDVDASFGPYGATARPPLQNVLSAAFLAMSRDAFTHHQLVMATLNATPFFAAALLVPSSRVPLLAALCALSPSLLQNAAFLWTKSFAAFFVVLALALYVRARASDGRRALAFGFIGAAALVHYSAIPFGLLVVAHHLWRRPRALAAPLWGAAVFAPWLAWSLWTYGAGGTFAANTTAEGYAGESLARSVVKVATNLWHTCVPWPLRPAMATNHLLFDQQNGLVALRDRVFTIQQHALPWAIGTVAGWLVVVTLLRALRRDEARARFWCAFAAAAVVFGVATHGTVDEYGLVDVCLVPLVPLGLAWLVARWPHVSPGWRRVAILGVVVDALLGVLLHVAVQAGAPTFPAPDSLDEAGARAVYGVGNVANWQNKLVDGTQVLADELGPALPFSFALFVVALVAWCVAAVKISAAIRLRARASRSGRRPTS